MRRILYSLFFMLMVPFIVIRLYYKSRKNSAYRKRWLERFGYFTPPKTKGGIWVHVVSVGETIAAVPMIKALQKTYPDKPLIITTMTPTGSERVRALFHDTVFHVYVPYDYPGAIKRFLKRVEPCMLILMETELWPNCLHYCSEKKIPVLLANARLSQKAYLRYNRIKSMTATMLSQISIIAAQAQPDAERFIALGAPSERVVVTGSMKFDISIKTELKKEGKSLRETLGLDRSVWIAASTHENEEEEILKAFQKIQQRVPDVLLILVPRHPERFDKVAKLCVKLGYQISRRSLQEPCTASTTIYLGDTMGELLLLYSASDVAFIGGSLVPIGGHNMLEPAVLGVPSITGPHYFNFTTIVQLLEEAGGLFRINDTDGLAQSVIDLLRDPLKRQQAGLNAQHIVEAHRGSVAMHQELIEKLYPCV
ncbi:MAG: 3-deoxy-D-manno-octulosonic acid transferase [Legionellales bacterium]|nr:3-deoxy-D-manno-octulosonic acid transferase [Legionellales bacterium]